MKFLVLLIFLHGSIDINAILCRSNSEVSILEVCNEVHREEV